MKKTLPPGFRINGVGQAALIVVGTEWCGHCANAKPVIKQVDTAIGKVVPVYWVDGDKHAKKIQSWGVEGFPTVMYRTPEGKVYRYDGPMTFDGITNFMCGLRPEVCTRIK